MRFPAFATSLAEIGGDQLWRTNPVSCVERLLDIWGQTEQDWLKAPYLLPVLIDELNRRGIALPGEALRALVDRGMLSAARSAEALNDYPCPGVVGLVVNELRGHALVVPLEVKRSPEWSVDPTLPFSRGTVLQDLLIRLLEVLRLPSTRAVPERFAFSVHDLLGSASVGPSMDVAGVLAIIRAFNECPEVLTRACAVVEPDGDRLKSVGSVESKLSGFVREYGRGTLLVRHSQCAEAAAFDGHFDRCWVVDSLNELAENLDRQGLLRPLLVETTLDADGAEVVNVRLHRLIQAEHRYGDALNLSSRVLVCGYKSEVSARRRRDVEAAMTDLYRHLGYYEEAERLAQKEVDRALGSAATSYDRQVLAVTNLAAALYDAHRFREAAEILVPWCEHLDDDPRICTPMTRVMHFNTLGRVRVILQEPGWQELFLRSAEILREWDPTELPRTRSYLLHGYLRHGWLDEAEAVIREIEKQPGLREPARWFLRFYQAEHARQRGGLWTDSEMEAARPDGKRVGHPFGFYLQATARQLGRAPSDAADRFRRAAAFFSHDQVDDERPNVERLLAACMHLGEAAWCGNTELWRAALEKLEHQIRPTPGARLHEHYVDAFRLLGATQNRETADAFLSRVPFF
jgi:hypothetical protein